MNGIDCRHEQRTPDVKFSMPGPPTAPRSFTPQKVVAGIGGALLSLYSIMVLMSQVMGVPDPFGIVMCAGSGTAAALCWWVVFRIDSEESRQMVGIALRYGAMIGAGCFVLGFVGPMIFMPDSNQGPLLGIFITGPAGFVAGIVVGIFVGRRRRGSSQSITPGQKSPP